MGVSRPNGVTAREEEKSDATLRSQRLVSQFDSACSVLSQ